MYRLNYQAASENASRTHSVRCRTTLEAFLNLFFPDAKVSTEDGEIIVENFLDPAGTNWTVHLTEVVAGYKLSSTVPTITIEDRITDQMILDSIHPDQEYDFDHAAKTPAAIFGEVELGLLLSMDFGPYIYGARCAGPAKTNIGVYEEWILPERYVLWSGVQSGILTGAQIIEHYGGYANAVS